MAMSLVFVIIMIFVALALIGGLVSLFALIYKIVRKNKED